MNLRNGATINQYKIISAIGKGGIGEVFLAEDTKLDRKVALKILPSELAADKDRMGRFVREAKSASALNHPNIITIYEIGKADRKHFIATEFIDGKTLSDYAKTNPLNYKSALEIAIQVASAFEEAHQAGIVHRDIKPDNVMVRANGLVKVLDFGIAKLSVPAMTDGEAPTAIQSTSPGMIIGTANYMSPEQAKGKDVDARTDIFSFGVMLYEMIAGHKPFEGENALEMIGAILKDEPKHLNAGVPAEIQKIIGECLRKDRDERYQTIRDVGNDLKEVKQKLELRNLMERSLVPNELEMVDVQKDSVIWSEQYNRKQSELVSLQSEIARDVTTNLKAKLSGAEEQRVTKTGTADTEAYQAYLKGRYYWNRRTAENLKKAIEQSQLQLGKTRTMHWLIRDSPTAM